MKIGRFPKMVILQYERAKALGYSENDARAIGYAQAQKYAIFKNIRIRISDPKKKGSGSSDIYIHPIFKLYMKKGLNYPVVAGKVIYPEKFNFEMKKRGVDIYHVLDKWAKEIISKTPREILENEQKFFKLVWVPHRDEQPLEMELDK